MGWPKTQSVDQLRLSEASTESIRMELETVKGEKVLRTIPESKNNNNNDDDEKNNSGSNRRDSSQKNSRRQTVVVVCDCHCFRSRKGQSKTGEKAVPAAYRPAAAPACSQCGEPFQPEKLHSHMKSCKALRGRSKKTKSETKPRSTTPRREGSSTCSADRLLLTD